MPDDKELIAGTIEDLRESLEVLRSHMRDLSEEIRRKEERLAAWESRLRALEGSVGAAGSRTRAAKGANLRTIASFLSGRLEGETAAKIRQGTGLPWSSVQRVLFKNKDIFTEADGLWRLAPTGAKKFGKGAFALNGTTGSREGMTEEETM